MTTTTPSYLDRLINHLETTNKTKFSLSDLKSEFKKFQTADYEERKNNNITFTFGKYKGKKISEVILFDQQYIIWLKKQNQILDKYPGLQRALTP